MLSHHQTPGGTSEPHYLVTTTHIDGVTCHHTGASIGEVRQFAAEHAKAGEEVSFWTVAPGRIDGIHWQLVA